MRQTRWLCSVQKSGQGALDVVSFLDQASSESLLRAIVRRSWRSLVYCTLLYPSPLCNFVVLAASVTWPLSSLWAARYLVCHSCRCHFWSSTKCDLDRTTVEATHITDRYEHQVLFPAVPEFRHTSRRRTGHRESWHGMLLVAEFRTRGVTQETSEKPVGSGNADRALLLAEEVQQAGSRAP